MEDLKNNVVEETEELEELDTEFDIDLTDEEIAAFVELESLKKRCKAILDEKKLTDEEKPKKENFAVRAGKKLIDIGTPKEEPKQKMTWKQKLGIGAGIGAGLGLGVLAFFEGKNYGSEVATAETEAKWQDILYKTSTDYEMKIETLTDEINALKLPEPEVIETTAEDVPSAVIE